MARLPAKIAGQIYRNCDKIAELNNEIRRLRAENQKLEHTEHLAKVGTVKDLIQWRNANRYPQQLKAARPRKAA